MSGEDGEELVSLLVDKFEDELAGTLAEEVTDQMGPSLESMSPEEAVDKYFDTRELNPNTERTHHSSLYNFFLQWCEEVAAVGLTSGEPRHRLL